MPSPLIISPVTRDPKPLSLHRRLRQRRRLPTVRLGRGRKRGWREGGRFVMGIVRQLRLRLLISQYLKRIKACCMETMREIVDGAATVEAVQARMLTEKHFTVPVMPVSAAVGNHLK